MSLCISDTVGIYFFFILHTFHFYFTDYLFFKNTGVFCGYFLRNRENFKAIGKLLELTAWCDMKATTNEGRQR